MPPPPPRYTSSNISGTPWATDLKLSDNLNELNWKIKIYFQPPPPTLGYHSNVQSWRMFLKSAFRQFSCQSLPELDVFCYSHKEWPNCSLLWKFGLNIPQDGVLVTVFVSHSFSCFNDLKMGNTISMATRMVSFDLVFHKLSENISFVDLQQGEHGFSFWMGIPSQKSETYEPP